MRFNVELHLDEDKISKDKNRIFLSLMKNTFEKYDKEYFEKVYNSGPKRKGFTFALYMKDAKFNREDITIPSKKVIFRYSSYDFNDSIIFYNSFLKRLGMKYAIKNNGITIKKINIEKEKNIYENEAAFKTLSPIVIKDHMGDNNKTWYWSINDSRGKEIFFNNLKFQLYEKFGQERKYDIEEIDILILYNKEVKVKNYGIEVLGNLCKFKVYAKNYILDYIYKAGTGSLKSSGFGMLDLL